MPRAKKTYRRANGDGTVYNLGGQRRKPWVAKYPIKTEFDPRLKRKYRQVYEIVGYYESKDDAQMALLNYKKEGNKKKYLHEFTFEEIYKNMSVLVFPSIGKEAQEKYEWAYQKFSPLHKYIFKDIGLFEIQEIMDSLEIKKESKQKIKSVLNAMYKYAIPRNIVSTNYASYIIINAKSKESQPLHSPFTDAEIQKLWKHKSDAGVDTILIMIYMGYRPSEMLGILNDSVDLDIGYIKGGNKTDAGKNKIVPIPNKIMVLIKNRYTVGNKYLISKNNGQPYTYDNYRIYVFNEIMKRLNMNHKPHDGRHTFTTLLSNVNENPTTIKKLVGHKNFKMTEDVYIHKNIEQLKDAINKI